jgi:hypothetical protein
MESPATSSVSCSERGIGSVVHACTAASDAESFATLPDTTSDGGGGTGPRSGGGAGAAATGLAEAAGACGGAGAPPQATAAQLRRRSRATTPRGQDRELIADEHTRAKTAI